MSMNMKNKSKILIIGVIVVAVLVITAGTLFAIQTKRNSNQVQTKKDSAISSGQTDIDGKHLTYKGQQYEYNKDIKTVLFLGIDKKGDMKPAEYPGEGGQSDCIILMALDEKEKTVQMFQISRNTMTDVDVYNANGEYMVTTKMQLTVQYAYGDGDKRSIWLTKKAVSNLLYGVPINSTISMNIDGITAINDILGGITITVPEDYTDIDPAFVKGSTIKLTGPQAERYVRYRDITITGSNMGRMDRQTQFVMALISQLKQASQKDKELYSKLMTGANPYFITDMSTDDIQSLSQYEMLGKIQTLPGEEVAGEKYDEFYTNEEELQEIIVNTFYKVANK